MVQAHQLIMCNPYTRVLYAVLLWVVTIVDGQTIFYPDSTNSSSTSISESATSGTLVYTVSGTSTLTFNKLSQSPISPDFPFDGSTGELTSPNGLDTETVPEFTFVFSGTDGASTVISGTLTVAIANVNDNPPVFTESSYTTTIVDSVSDGYVITTVNATDQDVSYFHLFAITAGDTSTFDIGQTTGVLTVQTASNLDASTTPSYTLTIEVSDTTYTDTMTIVINVQADPCLPNPCQNSGSCSYSGGSYLCTCTAGYIGTNCTDDDPCWPLPCMNSGNCSINGTGYICTCPTGWIDDTCSTDDPCLPNPCDNSGTCSVIGTSYQCACASGFSGNNCTNTGNGDNEADNPSGDNTVIIVVSVVIAVLVFSLILIVLVSAKLRPRMFFRKKLNEKQERFNGGFRSSSKNSVGPSNST